MSQFRRKLLESYATNKLVYPGLIAAWSAKGKTNEDADRNVLKDLTGNGHDITLNNFAYSGMSGYGGFDYPVKSRYILQPKQSIIWGVIPIKNGIPANTLLPNFDIQVSGFTNGKLYVNYPRGNYKKYLTNGLNHITDIPIASTVGDMFIDIVDVTDFNQEIIVEFIPKYPDALVFDGVDDYGVNENMPILTDYTILVKRKYIGDITKRNYSTVIAKTNGIELSGYRDSIGLFAMECKTVNGSETRTFGMQNRVNYVATNITWQKRYNYNGISLGGYGDQLDSNHIGLGAIIDKNKAPYRLANFAFYSAYLFDRSLDDQEIKSFIRKHIDPEYLLPSELPTPDVYYDFTNGDNSKGEANNVIKDLSGNGNDAVAHNFVWNEESGYARGGLKFDGVDDYITLNNTNNTKIYYRTVIGVVTCYNDSNNIILYDQRVFDIQTRNGALYYSGVLYYGRNNVNREKCLTYINGKLNDANFGIQSSTAVNKKHCFAVTFDDTEFDNVRKDFIRISSTAANMFYANMNMYKFMAFKDRLTEEQIKAVINKYNLLDGVDNIN